MITFRPDRPEEKKPENADCLTVRDFGREWSSFDQLLLSDAEALDLFGRYFEIFPWNKLSASSVGFDLGCGSGRWALRVAPRVGHLHCIDASEVALAVAKKNLKAVSNCSFAVASVENMPIQDNSMDFGYSLGVLHHVPDTAGGLLSCVSKLKKGAPFLVYLYYAFDNRPVWFQSIWRVSDVVRRLISRLPYTLKYCLCGAIATFVYFPTARVARLIELAGANVDVFPLSSYRNRSFYTMRTDALDRFGTRLEQRFTKRQIVMMMEAAGLVRICFSDNGPYWCAVGYKDL